MRANAHGSSSRTMITRGRRGRGMVAMETSSAEGDECHRLSRSWLGGDARRGLGTSKRCAPGVRVDAAAPL